MGYCETQLLLSMEGVEQVQKELCRLIRGATASRALINEALQRRDLAVEEVQEWQQRADGQNTNNQRL